jgi:cupin fold WbuC family metalloprotein
MRAAPRNDSSEPEIADEEHPLLIDQSLLDAVSLEASQSPRRRKNRNFHDDEAALAHRLLNAIEPGSYLIPHRHVDPNKDETMVALRGRLGVVFFDDAGQVQQTLVLTPAGTEPAGSISRTASITQCSLSIAVRSCWRPRPGLTGHWATTNARRGRRPRENRQQMPMRRP